MSTHRIATRGWLFPSGTKQRLAAWGFSFPDTDFRGAVAVTESRTAAVALTESRRTAAAVGEARTATVTLTEAVL